MPDGDALVRAPDELGAVVEGVDGLKLAEVMLEGVEDVALPEVDGADGADKGRKEEEELPSHTKMCGANSNKNESLKNFGAIPLWSVSGANLRSSREAYLNKSHEADLRVGNPTFRRPYDGNRVSGMKFDMTIGRRQTRTRESGVAGMGMTL